jgi:ubiquinone/menaquinone biosynthesis C-methylase UbiE
VIRDDGWVEHCIWEHSSNVKELYRRRCRLEAEEMTAHAQAAELLAPHVEAGDTLLDAGCGSGSFWHSLRTREIPVEYHGIDQAPSLIEIGREELPAFGLPAERLRVLRIEDLAGEVDHVVCINVLSNLDNYHRPLERLLETAQKTVIIRESLKQTADYRYVQDPYLDEGVDLKVHVNAYPVAEVTGFMKSYGFSVRYVEDRHTKGEPQLVIDHPHYWTFLVAGRTE